MRIFLIPIALLFSPSLSIAEEANPPINKEEAIVFAKKEVLEAMVDPDSTNFKIDFAKPMEKKEEVDEYGNQNFPAIVCGKYNSKNRMGGYNGYMGFIATLQYKNNILSSSLIFEENYPGDENALFQGFVNIFCK